MISERVGEGVRKVYEEVLVPAGMGDVAIYTEMGRFMMGPYGCLVTKAIHEKHTHKRIYWCGCVCCKPDASGNVWRIPSHHCYGKRRPACDHMYDVTGSLCEKQ